MSVKEQCMSSPTCGAYSGNPLYLEQLKQFCARYDKSKKSKSESIPIPAVMSAEIVSKLSNQVHSSNSSTHKHIQQIWPGLSTLSFRPWDLMSRCGLLLGAGWDKLAVRATGASVFET